MTIGRPRIAERGRRILLVIRSVLALALGACAWPATAASQAPVEAFVGCYRVTVRQDSLLPAAGGATGDSLPNPFTLHLTGEPVTPAQDPHHRGGRYADWDYLSRDEGLTAWWLADDTVHVYSVMYGWNASMSLAGRPSALTGTATVGTHRGYREDASLQAVPIICPDSAGG